jgi:hypothetical protein
VLLVVAGPYGVALTQSTGWIVVVLLGAVVVLPYMLRGGTLHPSADRPPPYLHRLWPHYWLGYTVAAVALVHGWLPMAGGWAGRTSADGLLLATAALAFSLVQVAVGSRLRSHRACRRPLLRRAHFWLMISLALLAAGHIALNGSTVRILFR